MLELMKKLAVEAGEMCLDASRNMDEVTVEFKSARDLVTAIDKQVEQFVAGEIRLRFPEHTIIGEEEGSDGTDDQRCWLIDPIDGTNSFVHGLPGYSVSIAYRENGRTTLGVVYAPVLGMLFTARRGAGAFMNNVPLHVSKCSRLIDSVWATGFACIRAGETINNLPNFNTILPEIRDFRRMGSAALDLAFVAAGKLDGFWEMSLNSYDVAAGVLLVEEAGGFVCDFEGGEDFPDRGIVAGNGHLTEPLLDLIRRASRTREPVL